MTIFSIGARAFELSPFPSTPEESPIWCPRERGKPKTGWSAQYFGADKASWRFVDSTGANGGIISVAWKRKGNTYKFKIKGKHGAFAVDPANLPLTGTFIYGNAGQGQCAELQFVSNSACIASSSSVKCK